MNVVAVSPSSGSEINDIVDEIGGFTEIDFQKIIEEEFEEKGGSQSIEDFYSSKTNDTTAHFAKLLVEEWVPWVEKEVDRASGKEPDLDYYIHSIKVPEEVKYVKKHLDGGVAVIVDIEEEEFFPVADLIVRFNEGNKGRRVIRSVINEFSDT